MPPPFDRGSGGESLLLRVRIPFDGQPTRPALMPEGPCGELVIPGNLLDFPGRNGATMTGGTPGEHLSSCLTTPLAWG